MAMMNVRMRSLLLAQAPSNSLLSTSLVVVSNRYSHPPVYVTSATHTICVRAVL